MAWLAFWLTPVSAFPPSVKPNIYLADNLDESQQLGYCIDISGHGSSINCGSMQAHSCKAAGADTQFSYDVATKTIKAANYDGSCAAGGGGCLAVLGSLAAGSNFQVTTCDGSSLQTFSYSSDRTFVAGGSAFCLAVSAASRAAGPFMARDLALADCSSTDSSLTTWTAVDASGSELEAPDISASTESAASTVSLVSTESPGESAISSTASETTPAPVGSDGQASYTTAAPVAASETTAAPGSSGGQVSATTAAPSDLSVASSSRAVATFARLGVCTVIASVFFLWLP